MKGPECGAWTRVLETRVRPSGETRRRYECANEHRFTSVEVIVALNQVPQVANLGRAGLPRRYKSPEFEPVRF